MSARVACAILAAGASRRLGHPKQLLLHGGTPLVRLAAACARQSRAAACAVVLGAHANAVQAAVAGLDVDVLENEAWSEGVASSIRTACAWANRLGSDALLLALCDQPRLTAQHLDQLIGEYERTGLLTASSYAGKNAVPALFPRAHFATLAALHGDTGASPLLNGAAHVHAVPWADGELDIDTPASAAQLLH